MANYKHIENKAEKEFEEILLNMESEEFEEYFKKLIDNYYDYVFTYVNNPSEYHDEAKKKYRIIKTVKKLLKFKHNNLTNFEFYVRMDKAEDIAYNLMIDLHSMEESYNNIIYYNATQELNFINDTLTTLIELYNNNPSEDILSVIESTFLGTATIFRDIKKLPVYENLDEHKEEIQFRKEHFKDLTETEKKEMPEVINSYVFTVPVLSISLNKVLKEFYSIMEQLENILPEDVLTDYYFNSNASEMMEFYHFLLDSKDEDETEEDIKETVAYVSYLKKKNNKGYLYNIIESWS